MLAKPFPRPDHRQTLSWLFQIASLVAMFCAAGHSLAESDYEESFIRFAEQHCLACHVDGSAEGNLSIELLLSTPVAEQAEHWEKVVRKLSTRQMPPAGETRPTQASYELAIATLVEKLDRSAKANPNPGRTESIRRLTRTEYQNAVRDLLGVEVDVADLLPGDEASHGFDNITVTNLSPVLLERYISAAQKISRLAVGVNAEPAAEKTYRIRSDVTQDVHIPGTPIGSRGGTIIRHHFPQSGQYEVEVRLMRDRNEELEGRPGEYELEVILDRERVELLTFERPRNGSNDRLVDANLKVRFEVSAGPHEVGAIFLKKQSSLLESVRQPLNVHYNYYRHPRIEPAVYQLTIRGPLQREDQPISPGRSELFTCYPADETEAAVCAERILLPLLRRAYRREVGQADLDLPMERFNEGLESGGFAAGIESALASVLVNPQFLLRIERTPEQASPSSTYEISSTELASRLSFFLWSSIPDDQLLQLASTDELRKPAVLEQQVTRMLQDERASALTKNYATQWLYLRNLDAFIPDMRLYPDFDDNLRQALRKETELFFESIVREDRSVMELIDADYTYLNERLAKHYKIPHIYGTRFRRVSLDDTTQRGGLLRQGSILCVTSYANRTSPVIRGKWVLENLLGTPPPPPPPDVPVLDESFVSASLSVRDRLELHRENPTCAKCHDMIDPVGFALEHFDAIGRWRTSENGNAIVVESTLPDGTEIAGARDLEKVLLERPELFVQAFTEKLMTFALGRGLQYYDAPSVRAIVRDAGEADYRFSQIVQGIVSSVPFQMRKTP